eukprot:8762700-Pyramimonas_sp.AAC.1
MGKLHGSLARAGKVRGQTPKVAKQEKKKNPAGRALKRLKVTLPPTFGPHPSPVRVALGWPGTGPQGHCVTVGRAALHRKKT